MGPFEVSSVSLEIKLLTFSDVAPADPEGFILGHLGDTESTMLNVQALFTEWVSFAYKLCISSCILNHLWLTYNT